MGGWEEGEGTKLVRWEEAMCDVLLE